MADAETKIIARVDVRTNEQYQMVAQDEAYKRTKALLESNCGNRRALLEVLRACNVTSESALAYRSVEKKVLDHPVIAASMQLPHVLLAMLIRSGAVTTIAVPESQAMREDLERSVIADKPADYLVRITPAGSAILDLFDPQRCFLELLTQEPPGYRDIYAQVLVACSEAGINGLSRKEIEDALAGQPALTKPKHVYPS